jgi:choloylglycine hydrolase
LHYLVCDSTGTCASIEFLNGEMTVHTGDTMPVNVLTNSTYASSVDTLKRHEGFGGTMPIGTSRGSLDRFVRAASMLQKYDPATSEDAVGYTFEILASVGQGEWTKWSNVYDMTNRQISFRTYVNPKIRSFPIEAFDFSCDTPVKVLDVNAEGAGDVSDQFVEYTYQLNRNLIENAYRKTDFLKDVPDAVLDSVAAYPDSMICQQ